MSLSSTSPNTGLDKPDNYSLFTRNPYLEEQIADRLVIATKEYHGKSLRGRQCSKLPYCSAFLKELVPLSYHPLIDCLEALDRVLVAFFSVKS